MKDSIKKLVTLENIFGLLYIVFYFGYVVVNMYLNKGNYIINSVLLCLTLVYLLLYIYGVFANKNVTIKRKSSGVFLRVKNFLGFINASMILASLLSNHENTFATIFFAIIAILWYVIYLIVDVVSSLALHEFKKYTKEMGWKYDNRD